MPRNIFNLDPSSGGRSTAAVLAPGIDEASVLAVLFAAEWPGEASWAEEPEEAEAMFKGVKTKDHD
jgi:hypothetical protein